ncbi:MAG TPA: DciA family protein [Usitatibacter sp.]|nr:DciA family protein [Usitatibacter sp.]
MASEPISKLLGDSAELRPLAERLVVIQRLQKRYRTLAPESLASASRVCAIDGTTVVICAASGSVANALRHLAPRLLEGLRASRRNSKHPRDQELTSIRIEVQVDPPARPRPVKSRGEMPREKLAGMAGKLSESPLKETLERIGKPAQSRITRSKT